MLVRVLLIVLFCIVILSTTDGHVLILFDELPEYASNIIKNKKFKWKSFNNSFNMQHVLCEKIRIARVFTTGEDSTSQLENHAPKTNAIQKEIVDQELVHLTENSGTKQITLSKGKSKDMRCFTCLAADDGTYKWTVIYDSALASGFVFEETSEGITAKKSVALVDDEANILQTSQEELNSFFQKSIETAATQRESLCSLTSNLQFRLCALCADAIHGKLNPDRHSKMCNKFNEEFLYDDPYSNYYYPPKTVDETCLNITETFTNETDNTTRQIDVNMLSCRVSIRKFQYQFYISRNRQPKRSSQVFILMEKANEDQNKIERDLAYNLYVPLLGKHLNEVNELLRNIERRSKPITESNFIYRWIKTCIT